MPWTVLPRLAAVDGLEERRAALIRNLGIGGIDAHLAVVHPPIALVRQESPRLAAIVRSPDAALRRIRRGRRLTAPPPSAAASAAPAARSVPSSLTPAPVPPLGPTSIDA